ncbi:ribonuclease H-like domain-containing protein [Lysobacter sp. HDW10]|uniref:ribonuclease H-like domain-containing protein n=1 Tax=Lysobacter sp. HDW10 TaxID=2714936 RepID=UPI00140AD8E5|nr:ribonuclease H-like domain-containing protein [Lysobacter sp. HDW10]QIK80723.1 ribonuclease H-like domain-containing protein [Lysobacter sp. HDW10]
MTVSLERLRALRQQSGTPPSAGTPSRSDSRTQIDALRKLIRLKETAQPKRAPAQTRVIPGIEISEGLWLEESVHDLGLIWPDALCCKFDRREVPIQTRDLLFFDTETTGLSGGTGTRAFMIGAADIQGALLRVRQLTMSTLQAEVAMLQTFQSWLSPSTVLASYNGKSYDAPLLRTRYRLMRLAEPLTGLDHVDLLYPSRRQWKGQFENCRLATIERHVLRVVREDDLPGSEAPAAWLHYLRGGSATLLRRVLAHNHQDVVSLARLFIRLSEMGAVDRVR